MYRNRPDSEPSSTRNPTDSEPKSTRHRPIPDPKSTPLQPGGQPRRSQNPTQRSTRTTPIPPLSEPIPEPISHRDHQLTPRPSRKNSPRTHPRNRLSPSSPLQNFRSDSTDRTLPTNKLCRQNLRHPHLSNHQPATKSGAHPGPADEKIRRFQPRAPRGPAPFPASPPPFRNPAEHPVARRPPLSDHTKTSPLTPQNRSHTPKTAFWAVNPALHTVITPKSLRFCPPTIQSPEILTRFQYSHPVE